MRESYLPKKVAAPLPKPEGDSQLPINTIVLIGSSDDPNDLFSYGVWEEYNGES